MVFTTGLILLSTRKKGSNRGLKMDTIGRVSSAIVTSLGSWPRILEILDFPAHSCSSFLRSPGRNKHRKQQPRVSRTLCSQQCTGPSTNEALPPFLSRPSLPHLTRFLATVVMEKRQGSYRSWLNLIFDKFVGLKKIREREAVPMWIICSMLSYLKRHLWPSFSYGRFHSD